MRRALIALAVVLITCCSGFRPLHAAQADDFAGRLEAADHLYREGSYALALAQLQLAAESIPPGQQRRLAVLTADARWRAQNGSTNEDTSEFDRAERDLTAMIGNDPTVTAHDQIWAEAQESLAAFCWERRNTYGSWQQAWLHYEAALDWWAGSIELERARLRYLALVFNAAKKITDSDSSYIELEIPLSVLDRALTIATSDEERAHLHYLIALALRREFRTGANHDVRQQRRMAEEFDAVIALGKATTWYGDALFAAAELAMNQGVVVKSAQAGWVIVPGFERALSHLQRLTGTFAKGEHRRVEAALQHIKTITEPTVGLDVSSAFVPGSLIQYGLRWRNQPRIDLTLYRFDLQKDVAIHRGMKLQSWSDAVDLAAATKVQSWSHVTKDNGDHSPHQTMLRLADKVPTGAYIIEAVAGTLKARALLLISDVSAIVVTAPDGVLVYACSVSDGAPVPGARVQLWLRRESGGQTEVESKVLTADASGLCHFPLSLVRDALSEVLVFVASGERQGFSSSYVNSYESERDRASIYAYTDRAAYRPGDTVQWKAIVRHKNGGIYATPAGTALHYSIKDPNGAELVAGDVTLNAFGSCWAEIKLGAEQPLGEYEINFSKDPQHVLGSATLFRLEEYNLPEFVVAVSTPSEHGVAKTFRQGDQVEATIKAEYYFGGAVANAKVEVRTYVNQFTAWWEPPRTFPWLYEDHHSYHDDQRQGEGNEINKQFLTTDANGVATLRFPAPRSGPDLVYRIEARLTDSSRREVIGTGEVKVTRQQYYIYPRAEHQIYRPKTKVAVIINARDANQQPVVAAGAVTITRDWWDEVWVSPAGKAYTSAALKAAGIDLQAALASGAHWRCTFRDFRHDELAEQHVTTAKDGTARVEFTPERDGYYRVAWASTDSEGADITGDTIVWVADQKTAQLGIQNSYLDFIVDQDTVQVGGTLTTLLTTPMPGAWVLVGNDAADLSAMRVIHVAGTNALLEVPITDRAVPKFTMYAASIGARLYAEVSREVVVPPRAHSLTVALVADRPQYEPRQPSTWSVTVTDEAGKPVQAELSLAVADEATFAIQEDLAGDPRDFFFAVQHHRDIFAFNSGLSQRGYAKLVERPDDRTDLIDERDLVSQAERNATRDLSNAVSNDRNYDQRYDRVQDADAAVSQSESFALPVTVASSGFSLFRAEDEKKKAPAGGAAPVVQVRSDFRSTMFWKPDLVTDAQGKATATLTFGDALSTWRATARATTTGSQFGMTTTKVRTSQPVIARLQGPRFFVVGDRVVLSAVVSNNTAQVQEVSTKLSATGLTVEGLWVDGKVIGGIARPLSVPANGDVRVDWLVCVQQPGTATVKVEAMASSTHGDAMEKTFPIYDHGIDKLIASAGKLRDAPLTLTVNLPDARSSTAMTVQIAPSLATTMLDALPYLIDYPYGCTEQTMSRFLPTAIVAKTLTDLGIDAETAMERTFGGIEAASAAKLHPKGRKHLESITVMAKEGLERLAEFQHADGDWGWWKADQGDPYMTAYAVWGLTLASASGLELQVNGACGRGDWVTPMANRGARWLGKKLVTLANQPDLQAWVLHACAVNAWQNNEAKVIEPRKNEAVAFANLWQSRDQLNAFSRALLALCAHYYGDHEKAMALMRALENGVRRDADPAASVVIGTAPQPVAATLATAHWGDDHLGGRWSDGTIETTAMALRALLTIDPANPLVDASATWLIQNRRGAQWTNTRDTALVVLALSQYLTVTKEAAGEGAYELAVNGTSVAKRTYTSAEALSVPGRFTIPLELVKDGSNQITLTRTAGSGPLYLAAKATFFSREEPVTPAGNQIFVQRQYYRLAGRKTLLKGWSYEKVPLGDQEHLLSGDRVEVVITIEAKNDYDYLLFEDLKPAGFEAVQIKSGEELYARELRADAIARRAADPVAAATVTDADFTNRTAWIYQELRDRKVALFISHLPQGRWEIRYELRAEVPGTFHALPVLGHAMYVPEIRANSAEIRVHIDESHD